LTIERELNDSVKISDFELKVNRLVRMVVVYLGTLTFSPSFLTFYMYYFRLFLFGFSNIGSEGSGGGLWIWWGGKEPVRSKSGRDAHTTTQ